MTLGLKPLHRQLRQEPPYAELELGTYGHPMILAMARVRSSYENLPPAQEAGRRKSDGRRVGAMFREPRAKRARLLRKEHGAR